MIAPIRSILLLHSGALGDTVLHLRVAQVLRHAFGEVAITWLGRDAWLPIVRRCGCVDRLVGMDTMRIYRLFESGEQMDSDLVGWLSGFDLIVNTLVPAGSPAAARLSRCAHQAMVTYDTQPQEGSVEPIVWQWLVRIAAQLSSLRRDLGEAIPAVARSLLAEPALLFDRIEKDGSAGTGGVLIHPGSGGELKCWPMERYIQLVEMLRQRNMQPVMVLGPVEMEPLGRGVDVLRQRCQLRADPSLEDLMEMISEARMYIGNDSGPTHLAAAMGRATIAIFGPTDPRIWRPIGPQVTVLRSQENRWADLPVERVVEVVMR